MDMNKRLHLMIHGRVQGVFFRRFVCEQAQRLGLTGHVRNTNNEVEIVAEGDEKVLQELVMVCRKGPTAARVDKIDVEEEKWTGEFMGFVRRY